jgi:hypothetical protein
VVSVTDPYRHILDFLDSCYFSIKYLLSCTHEAVRTPFQTHYLFFGSAGNRSRASGSVSKNSDHYTTEAVLRGLYLIKFCMKLIAVISHDNYYSNVYYPFCELVQ